MKADLTFDFHVLIVKNIIINKNIQFKIFNDAKLPKKIRLDKRLKINIVYIQPKKNRCKHTKLDWFNLIKKPYEYHKIKLLLRD